MPAPPPAPEEKPQWGRGPSVPGYSSPSVSMPPHSSASPYAHHLPPVVNAPGGPDSHPAGQAGPLPPPPMSVSSMMAGPRSVPPMNTSRPPTSPSLSNPGHPSQPPHHQGHPGHPPHQGPPPPSNNPPPNAGPGAGPGTGGPGGPGGPPPPGPPAIAPNGPPPSGPSSGGPPPPSPSPSASNYRPLNVKDALSYLDQVKVQFQEHPDVYNRFLDIMKDFKSQNIDTPGVIERVSTLFTGHPSLISGFNTFLPPGYRIECSTNPNEVNMIRVTTPSGHTTTQMGAPIVIPDRLPPPPPPPHHSNQSSYYMQQNPNYQPPIPSISQMLPPVNSPQYGMGPQGAQGMGPGGGGGQGGPSGKKTPVEFNHAINYVHKIKNRFANDPDTYKQFLELLQAYQKEMKPITDVYSHVTMLFKNAPDLLDEFKQFLPENGNPNPDLFGGMMPQPAAPTPPPRSMPVLSTLNNGMAVGDFSPPSSDPYMKKGSMGPGHAAPVVNKKKRHTAAVPDRPVAEGIVGNKKRLKHSHPGEAGSPIIPPSQPEPNKNLASAEELQFFDRVKKFLGNKATYAEFLKLLNLFSQDILDRKLLVERVETFLGPNRELMDWFKSYVGWDGKDEIIENVAAYRTKVDLGTCRRYGESYRLLPKNETTLPCSGRDEMCWEVLNDVWASHPNWSVEGEGFMPHKKNAYEEALHKCEEERYEYDMNIEANLHTIALLEPINKQIQNMSVEERARFKLPVGLGGTSKTIYQRIIKKIYDKDRGQEVIDALHNNPAIAVPVVLKRLKQKDEEWKKAQREWNKVWREVDAKNFYKALDHQGLTFKVTDKRMITAKSLVAEIEAIRRDQIDRRLVPSVRPRYQFRYYFKDPVIFRDANDLILLHLEKQNAFGFGDREKMESFIREFIPQFFCLDSQFMAEDEVMEDATTAQTDSSNNQANGTGKTTEGGKDLKSGGNSDEALVKAEPKDEAMPSGPRIPITGTSKESQSSRALSPSNTWIQVGNYDVKPTSMGVSAGGSSETKRSTLNFFGNMTYYCFFRLYQLIYSRLETMRNEAEAMAKGSDRRTVNPAAVDLGLQDNRVEVDADIKTGTGNNYSKLLRLLTRFIEGDIEQAMFEESARYLFATKAYIVFTMDKLISALLKHVHTIVLDQRCNDLIAMFVKDRQHEKNSRRQQIIYRMQADAVVGEENLYKIEYNKDARAVSIQLLSKNDYTLDTAISSEEKWGYYIDSYVLLTPTEGVAASVVPTFMKRNLPAQILDEPPQDVTTTSGLEIKICINTYKIFFVNNTEDFFKRNKIAVPLTEAKTKELRAKRRNKFNAWLVSQREEHASKKENDEYQAEWEKWLIEGPPNTSPEDKRPGLTTKAVVVDEGTPDERKVYITSVSSDADSTATTATTDTAMETTTTASISSEVQDTAEPMTGVEQA
ncbi:Transcriptional regulatory protein sin3 [Actinomortierella wolfii]|nr:Transcriptional regulatory protein sin3 [Actinomortierella wolfii]